MILFYEIVQAALPLDKGTHFESPSAAMQSSKKRWMHFQRNDSGQKHFITSLTTQTSLGGAH